MLEHTNAVRERADLGFERRYLVRLRRQWLRVREHMLGRTVRRGILRVLGRIFVARYREEVVCLVEANRFEQDGKLVGAVDIEIVR